MMNLKTLLGSTEPETFLAEYWSKKALHVPGTPGKLEQLYDFDSFKRAISPDCPASVRLDKAWQERCWQAYGKFVELKITSADELGRVLLTGKANLTLAVDSDERIARLEAELTSALGLAGGCTAHAWLSMPGGGIRTHFDSSANFVLQIAGTKRWRISHEPVIRSPRFLAVCGPDGEFQYGAIDAHESDYVGRRVLESELSTVELAPNDVLYLPAGCWHGTEVTSKEPALAISLRPSERGFSALAAALIEEAFKFNAAWRQVPAALSHPDNAGAMPAHVLEYFSARLKELSEALGRMDPFTLHCLWKREMAMQQALPARMPLATPQLEPQDILCVVRDRVITYAIGEDARGKMRMIIYCGDKEIAIVNEQLFEFGVRLIRSGPFRADSMLAELALAGYSWTDVRAFLLRLIEFGLLKKADERAGP